MGTRGGKHGVHLADGVVESRKPVEVVPGEVVIRADLPFVTRGSPRAGLLLGTRGDIVELEELLLGRGGLVDRVTAS
jgi:hypothetical protein